MLFALGVVVWFLLGFSGFIFLFSHDADVDVFGVLLAVVGSFTGLAPWVIAFSVWALDKVFDVADSHLSRVVIKKRAR